MGTKSQIIWSVALCGFLAGSAAAAQTVTHPFLGVTMYHETVTSPRTLSINVAEIDLSAPGISFLVTPPGPSPQPVFNGVPDETVIQTPRQFLNSSGAQLAVNAGGSGSSFGEDLAVPEPATWVLITTAVIVGWGSLRAKQTRRRPRPHWGKRR
jgi:hypothetical protein